MKPKRRAGLVGRLERADSGWHLTAESWSRVVGGSGQRHEMTAHETRLVAEGFV